MSTLPLRVRIGRTLDLLGLLGLPLGIGVVLGFWAADQGLRLLPTLLELLTLHVLVSAVLVAVGRILKGSATVESPEGTRLRKRVIAVMVLAVLALGGRLAVWFTQQPSPITVLSEDDFETAFALDARRYQEHDQAMEELLRRLEAEPWLQPDAPELTVLSTEQELLLLQSWLALWTATVELDGIRAQWEDWYRFDPSRAQREKHLKSFLLTFAAELSLHQKAARLSRLVLPHDAIKKLLDQPRPELGLPKTSFSLYRQVLLGTADQSRVLAGQAYLDALRVGVRGRTEAKSMGIDWLWQDCLRHLDIIEAVAPIDRATLLVRADAQVLKRSLKRVWYPAQREVAEVMGDTRARRIGWYLIGEELQAQAIALSEPGDVMLARKNWYLSNAGLPGFWPHAILYIGPIDQLGTWSDSPEIRAWVHEQSGEDLSFVQWMERLHPAAWRQYRAGVDGHPVVIVEAVSEGVVLNSLPHAAGDYLGVLRPRLEKLAKAQAIAEAFHHLEKPYDFDFDFATDAALVCTELVWRAYRPGPGKAGLDLPLVHLAGRETLPANELALIATRSAQDQNRPFDPILFIDASELDRTAWMSTPQALLESPQRSRWDVATGRAPAGTTPSVPGGGH